MRGKTKTMNAYTFEKGGFTFTHFNPRQGEGETFESRENAFTLIFTAAAIITRRKYYAETLSRNNRKNYVHCHVLV